MGSGGSKENWTENDYQLAFYKLFWENRDKILIEVTGHDHIADFRSHSAIQLFDQRDKCLEQISNASGYFAGKMINPSITPNHDSQPGYVVMQYSQESLVGVQATYLDLESTKKFPKDSTFDSFRYLTVDYDDDFGLDELSAEGIANLNNRLNQSSVLF